MATSLNNNAWKKIFEELSLQKYLISDGHVKVSAHQIKAISNREPRLMCKFDDTFSRPEIFKNGDLSILPIKNGEYVIFSGDGYCKLPKINQSLEFLEWPFKKRLQTLPREPRSESQVIDISFATQILHHFLNEDFLTLTIRGRLRTRPFSFILETNTQFVDYEVDGVQVEVDAGYESETRIYIIEAKMGERDDFNVRQLFYPYRMWLAEGVTKEIVPIFINYANEIISISKFKFNDPKKLTSIELIDFKNYVFEPDPISIDLRDMLEETIPNKQEPLDIPFPQANDLRKVRDTIDLISRGYQSTQEIAHFWGVDKRQGDYYSNAARYLGFLTKDGVNWRLTKLGEQFVHLETTKRDRTLIEQILKMPVLNHVIRHKVDKINLSLEEIAKILGSFTGLNKSTLSRRAGTIENWAKYLIENYT